MRCLLFSDLHRDTAAAMRLVELSAEADIVIGAGDFASVRQGISTCIQVLRGIQKPTVLVAGNNESYEELVGACAGWSAAVVLHGSAIEISGITIFGIGGGIPVTPFGDWSWDLSEEDARRLLAACPPKAVLVSHSPPKGAVDRSSSGQSLGSVAVREAVIRLEPRLVVCGHIHASAGKREMLGKTPIINAGPAGVVYELAET